MKVKVFNPADIVFANLVQQGREIIAMKFTGVKNITDIVDYLRRRINANLGPVVIKVRNFTQGWTTKLNVMLRAIPVPQGTQLTFF